MLGNEIQTAGIQEGRLIPWKLIQEPSRAKSIAPNAPSTVLPGLIVGDILLRAEEPADGVGPDVAHFHRDDRRKRANAPEQPDLDGKSAIMPT